MKNKKQKMQNKQIDERYKMKRYGKLEIDHGFKKLIKVMHNFFINIFRNFKYWKKHNYE
jgi:hypothetical protein